MLMVRCCSNRFVVALFAPTDDSSGADAPLSGGPYRNLPYVLGVGPVKGLDGRITGAGLDLLKTMRTEVSLTTPVLFAAMF